MELLTRLNWVDLAIIVALAIGVFVGFTQGIIRYLLNGLAVIVAFVLAAQLKGPIVDLLGFWTAFSPEGRELLIFVLLFIGLVVAGWFVIRALYRRTRLPIVRQLDEIGGAILGLLWVALLITFHLVVYDSFFATGNEAGGWVAAYYDALNGSVIVEFFRDTLIPTAGFLARPFVPDEIARLLDR
ncbi:MAG TPA: CvpA family protein [Candidatus Limnocylindria bacterium]|nr:CvpA family protein [Candidatus Limnocylindria bacterium]